MKRIMKYILGGCITILLFGTVCYASVETVEDQEMTLNFSYGERTGIYSGEVKNGIPEGYGTFESTNDSGIGWTYEGQWKNGVFDGIGSCVWDNGLFYTGHYKAGEENGEIAVYQDGEFLYSGEFSEGQILGINREIVSIENEVMQYVQMGDMGFQIPISWTYNMIDDSNISINFNGQENAYILFSQYTDIDITDAAMREEIKNFYISDFGQSYPQYKLVTEEYLSGVVSKYNFHMTFYAGEVLVDVYADCFTRSDVTYITLTVMGGMNYNYYEAAKCIEKTLKGWEYIQQDMETQQLNEKRNLVVQAASWEEIESICPIITEQDVLDGVYPNQIVIVEGIVDNIIETGFDLWIPHVDSYMHTEYWRFNEWVQGLPPEVDEGSTVKICVETGEEGHLDSSERMLAIQSVDAEIIDDIISVYKQNCKNVDYKGILRNPEKARGSIWKATGEVLQVIRTTDSMQELLLQLDDGNVIYVWYYKTEGADNMLEEDYITVYGTFYVTETYTTILGETKTVPKLVCDYVDLL